MSTFPPVLGDRVQLQQVLLNLIMNGVEAMTASEGARELRVSSRQRGGNEVVVAIRDSGSGIDPERADQLFRPFFTTKPEGMGMGLSISRSLIEARGGNLSATANEDRGTTFRFSLPALA